MKRRLTTGLGAASAAITATALTRELRRKKSQRRWHGTVLGVPYDFRPPTRKRIRAAWWNPKDSRLITPRGFGVGWAVNLGRVWRLVGRG